MKAKEKGREKDSTMNTTFQHEQDSLQGITAFSFILCIHVCWNLAPAGEKPLSLFSEALSTPVSVSLIKETEQASKETLKKTSC